MDAANMWLPGLYRVVQKAQTTQLQDPNFIMEQITDEYPNQIIPGIRSCGGDAVR